MQGGRGASQCGRCRCSLGSVSGDVAELCVALCRGWVGGTGRCFASRGAVSKGLSAADMGGRQGVAFTHPPDTWGQVHTCTVRAKRWGVMEGGGVVPDSAQGTAGIGYLR